MKFFCRQFCLVVLFSMVMCKITFAESNPFQITGGITKANQKECTVIISVEKTELNAFGFTVLFDRNILQYKNKEQNDSGFTNEFNRSYGSKGMAVWNVMDSEIRFSGINADDESAVYQGDVAKIVFEVIDDTVTSSAVCLELRNLTASGNKVNVSDNMKKLYCNILFSGQEQPEATPELSNIVEENPDNQSRIGNSDNPVKDRGKSTGYLSQGTEAMGEFLEPWGNTLDASIVTPRIIADLGKAEVHKTNDEMLIDDKTQITEGTVYFEASSDHDKSPMNQYDKEDMKPIAISLGIILCAVLIIIKIKRKQ